MASGRIIVSSKAEVQLALISIGKANGAGKYRTADGRFVIYSEVTGHGERRGRRWRVIDTHNLPEIADGPTILTALARLDRFVEREARDATLKGAGR